MSQQFDQDKHNLNGFTALVIAKAFIMVPMMALCSNKSDSCTNCKRSLNNLTGSWKLWQSVITKMCSIGPQSQNSSRKPLFQFDASSPFFF